MSLSLQISLLLDFLMSVMSLLGLLLLGSGYILNVHFVAAISLDLKSLIYSVRLLEIEMILLGFLLATVMFFDLYSLFLSD